jgi:CHAT domain-containing protein
VASHLQDAETVYVVPDGALHVVSFAALPVAESGYLGETGPLIHYLVSERDLVPSPDQRSIGTGLLAVGGPAFGGGTAPSAAPRADCGTLQSLEFPPLPGTRLEVDDIAHMWQTLAVEGLSEGGAARVLSGREATEGAFKQGAPGHRVLHLATHGFFLDGSCQPAAAGTRAVGGLVARRPPMAPVENPLLLSGLALAGANRRAAAGVKDEDGILTAEEVIALNLEGVQWAVLSACDTGLGQTRAGEGVFGLRRAFQIAGARTLIMSLWSVSDEATTTWMRALYRARLEKQLNTAEAVRDASRSVLQVRRSKGLSTHPFYWAAFVAAGDWR